MAAARASLRRNERVVNAISRVMVMSRSDSFLLTGPLHRRGEVAQPNLRPPAKDGILNESCELLTGKQDATGAIDAEASQGCAYGTGESQLAPGIKEQQHTL